MSAATDRAVRQAVVGATALAVGGLLLLPRPAAAVEPLAGSAVVDGVAAEWTPADDVAALVGNDPPHVERGRLSLRYDCDTEVLYALLQAGPGVRFLAIDPDEAYLRFGDEAKLVSGEDGVDGVAPDAAWIDHQGDTAAGIEMSAPVAPGTHDDLRVHAKVPNDSADGYETVDLSPRYQELVLACGTDVDPVSLVRGGDPADPGDPPDPGDLARTGAPVLPWLAGGGLLLVVVGAALRLRRWDRPAGP